MTTDAPDGVRRAEAARLGVVRPREDRLGAPPSAVAVTGMEVPLTAVVRVADRPVEMEVALAGARPVGQTAPWGRAEQWTLPLWPC